jgi:hypothetical protein
MKDLLVLKNQWQAQPVAQPPPVVEVEAALTEVVSELMVAGAAFVAVAVDDAASVSPAAGTGAAVVPEPPLKSVAYQPEPLS